MSNLDKSAEEIERLVNERVEASELAIATQYAVTLNEIRKMLAKLYEKYETGGVLTYAEMAKYDRLTKFMRQIDRLLGIRYKHLKSLIYEVLGDSYIDGYYLTAWAVETDTLNRLAYSAVAAEVITAMIENPISGLTLSDRLEKNRANIVYTIQQEITQGLVKGETYGKMANRIKGALEGDTVKAIRIVRTEAHRAKESGKLDAAIHANKNGVIMMKEWNTMQDERVRPGRGIGKKDAKHAADHRMLNGKKIPVENDFVGKLGKGSAPGQLGHPGEDINCRCFLTYSVKRVEKVDSKKLESMTFEDWKENRLSGAKKKTKSDIENEIKHGIINGKYNLKMKKESYEKHLKGHKRFIEYQQKNRAKGLFGPSYLTISAEEAQELINKYAGTGILEFDRKGNWTNKEIIQVDRDIGVHVSLSTGIETPSNCFKIHYSKSGTHIVPTLID
ncbi:minor capsid protein [Aeribacillus phage AP45]|uniref:Minor capsid protein n=1 Tax=Aeribacillus phage AP45 TaxID=1913112 RepID=A0A1L2JY53_9CAUD|nr:minor capsid protein [Aeribacillus phage AP45]APC46495.1 minor capsid protein [Aeribacillus phage AP45]